MHEFDAIIEEARGGGALVACPFDVRASLGSARPKVNATFDGVAYRGSIASMGGRYVLGIRKDVRQAIGKGPGDRVRVTVRADSSPRIVQIPADLAAALAESELASAFDALSYTRRRVHVTAIEGAKRPDTRARRVARVIASLRG